MEVAGVGEWTGGHGLGEVGSTAQLCCYCNVSLDKPIYLLGLSLPVRSKPERNPSRVLTGKASLRVRWDGPSAKPNSF